MKAFEWEFVDESTDRERMQPGGYVVVITGAEDNPQREYIELIYDIAEGPRKGYYSDDFGRNNPWAHHFFRSYKPTALPMFKAFLKRLEDSNEAFTIQAWQQTSDEKAFIGLELGIILQSEEYEGNDGSVKTRLNVARIVSADTIRRGDFTVPEPKKLERAEKVYGGSGSADTYSDLPFTF